MWLRKGRFYAQLDANNGKQYKYLIEYASTPILNARNYQVQMSTGTGAWQDVGIFPQARRIVLESLTPGTIYNVRLRALGGSTGYSDWSISASLMAT